MSDVTGGCRSGATAATDSQHLLQVKGRRLDTNSGPRTRSRAAKQAEQWDVVSLRLKLLVLTVDALLEAQAQVGQQQSTACCVSGGRAGQQPCDNAAAAKRCTPLGLLLTDDTNRAFGAYRWYRARAAHAGAPIMMVLVMSLTKMMMVILNGRRLTATTQTQRAQRWARPLTGHHISCCMVAELLAWWRTRFMHKHHGPMSALVGSRPQVTKPALEDLVAQAVADEADDDNLADVDFRDDPITSIDLAAVLVQQLRRFAAADAARFEHMAAYLTPTQRNALQSLA